MHTTECCIFCSHGDLVKTPAIVAPFVADRALQAPPVKITADWGLRDIPEGIAHVRCNSTMCMQCFGLFMDLRFDPHEMARLYTDYRGTDYTMQRCRHEPGYGKISAFLSEENRCAGVEDFLRPCIPVRPRILDWGGDSGRNTPFRQEASTCHVVDISGITPLPGVKAVSPEEALAGVYDLVILSHTLEHLPAPQAMIEQLKPLLTKGGKLYLEVPYEQLMQQQESLPFAERSPSGKRYWHEHINFFSPEALRHLVRQAGLRPIKEAQRSDRPNSAVLAMLCEFDA